MPNKLVNKLSAKNTTISENNAYSEIYKNLIKHGYGEKQISFSRLGDIDKYLPYFKGRALTLYVFYLSKAKNNTGVSYWSIQRIADKLGASAKSITTWNLNLIELGLIYRQNDQNTDISSKTYLLPTQSFIVPITTEYKEYNDFLTTTKYIQQNIYSVEVENNLFINYIVYLKKPLISKVFGTDKENILNNYIILENKTKEPISKSENIIWQKDIEQSTDPDVSKNMTMLIDSENLSKEKIEIILSFQQ